MLALVPALSAECGLESPVSDLFVRAMTVVALDPRFAPAPTPVPAPLTYEQLEDRDWDLLVKTPDAYIGNGYVVWACIFQFDAATGDEAFLAFASNTVRDYWSSEGDNSRFTGDAGPLAAFVEDDLVSMNVVSLGSYSYDTQRGGNTTVPMFQVDQIALQGSCA